MKAVTAHTLFIIGVVLISLLIIVFIFFDFSTIFSQEANEQACQSKLIKYCFEWRLKGLDPSNPPTPSWNEREPKGCEQFGITEPSPDDCKINVQS